MRIPIYYINLASRPDRRAFMEDQLARLGLKSERIEAVTPADIPEDDIARFCDNTRSAYLRANQLACSMSHEKAWGTMLAAGHERAVVMEDDSFLSALLPAFLGELDSVVCDILRFETPSRKVRVLPPVSHVGPSIALRPFRSTLPGCSGYIIGRRAANALLGNPALRRTPVDRVVNGALEEPGLRLVRYLTDPGLCVQVGNSDVSLRGAGVGWSDLNATKTVNLFARNHPVRHFFHRNGRELAIAIRSSADHLAHLGKGVAKETITFRAE